MYSAYSALRNQTTFPEEYKQMLKRTTDQGGYLQWCLVEEQDWTDIPDEVLEHIFSLVIQSSTGEPVLLANFTALLTYNMVYFGLYTLSADSPGLRPPSSSSPILVLILFLFFRRTRSYPIEVRRSFRLGKILELEGSRRPQE